MRDTIGTAAALTLFGESHGPAVGCVLQGVAPGVRVDEDFIAAQMEKRRAKGRISTARTEADRVRILSGVKDGLATGTAITLVIENTNTRSGDYAKTQDLLRPGHADYTAHAKYHGFQDARGGGHFSGRLTAPLVAGGAIFVQLLRRKGVRIGTHLLQCAGVDDAPLCPCGALWDDAAAAALAVRLDALAAAPFPAADEKAGQRMVQAIEAAAAAGDSVGGVLETVVTGLPAGLGEPFFGSVESVLAALLFSMPAVKGVEFGGGFALAALRGSEANDPLYMAPGGRVAARTNRNGGVNGGITNGMPVVFRTVVKPTPSIYKPQHTVDFSTKQDAVLQIEGRHDPCIAHRACVVQDSLAALGIADLLGVAFGLTWQEGTAWNTV